MKPKILAVAVLLAITAAVAAQRSGVPKFEVDPFWPKPLPNKWMLGQVGGTFVDSHDHLWVTTRPRSLDEHDRYADSASPKADCCVAPPPILEFDPPHRMLLGSGKYFAGNNWPIRTNMTTDLLIEPQPEGCILRIVQELAPPDELLNDFFDACVAGWQNSFEGMRNYLHNNPTE